MKKIVALILTTTLIGCGTVGGTLSGAGEDLKKVGDWVKSK
jgi:predicted small secreted protein